VDLPAEWGSELTGGRTRDAERGDAGRRQQAGDEVDLSKEIGPSSSGKEFVTALWARFTG
jgi:hypothetical protein